MLHRLAARVRVKSETTPRFAGSIVTVGCADKLLIGCASVQRPGFAV